jgi:hypothetical protein
MAKGNCRLNSQNPRRAKGWKGLTRKRTNVKKRTRKVKNVSRLCISNRKQRENVRKKGVKSEGEIEGRQQEVETGRPVCPPLLQSPSPGCPFSTTPTVQCTPQAKTRHNQDARSRPRLFQPYRRVHNEWAWTPVDAGTGHGREQGCGCFCFFSTSITSSLQKSVRVAQNLQRPMPIPRVQVKLPWLFDPHGGVRGAEQNCPPACYERPELSIPWPWTQNGKKLRLEGAESL